MRKLYPLNNSHLEIVKRGNENGFLTLVVNPRIPFGKIQIGGSFRPISGSWNKKVGVQSDMVQEETRNRYGVSQIYGRVHSVKPHLFHVKYIVLSPAPMCYSEHIKSIFLTITIRLGSIGSDRTFK